jgi:hypothetical protein
VYTSVIGVLIMLASLVALLHQPGVNLLPCTHEAANGIRLAAASPLYMERASACVDPLL